LNYFPLKSLIITRVSYKEYAMANSLNGNGKCQCSCSSALSKLCPLSFGLALGITSMLIVFFWSVWIMYNGVAATMPGMQELEWGMVIKRSLMSLLKGFVIGFIFALI